MVAIRDACTHLQSFSLAGCEIYSSCEPCPLCLAAIYWAHLDRFPTRPPASTTGPFYAEFAKSGDDRRIPMDQALRDQARAVLHEWAAKPDRIRY